MYKRLLYILSLAFALTSFLQPAQAAPDINIDEDVADEQAKATAYRFWIDDNTDKSVASLNGEDIESNIDVSNLSIGVHIYHIQLRDQYGRWGTTTDIPFYAGYQNTDVKEDDSNIPPVEKVIYWIDDNYDNKVTQAYTEADMSFEQDISNLAGGKHSYSFIALNSQNRTAAITGSFYMPTTDGNDDESGEKEVITIVSYQYWVDDDKANAKTLPYTSDDISQQIDYTQLAEGVHTLHFRLRNNEGIWSNYEYPFYTPGTNSTEQAETQQPITGYRYGVNGKTVTKDITEVDNVPALSVEIPFPTAQEFANVEDYEFTTDNASNDVKVKRVGDLTYFIQFKNKAGNWGEPVFIDSLASDSTIRTAKELELQHTLGIRKLGKGDYDIAKFTIADNNGYYFGSSSNCNVMLYQDNKHLSTFSPEQMVSNKSTLLAPGTYFAIIYNQDQDGSIRLTGSKNWANDPVFGYANHQLSISSDTPGATIRYTLDGTMPTSESAIYTAPLDMTQNTRVKAIASADGMSDSYIQSYLVGDFDPQTCADPQVNYDGRKVTLTSSNKNADIYYTLDGSDPTTQSQLYNIDVGIAVSEAETIKAFATMDLMNNSKVITYDIPSYYDGNNKVSVKIAGNLATAFDWCGGKPQQDILNVTGNVNAADFAALAKMSNLRLLDMNAANTEGNTINEQAFAGMNIVSASLPATLTTCGKEIFANCPKLAAVIWNSNSAIPADALNGINNPNLLLYVNTKSAAPAGINNVVASGIAENVVLSTPNGETESNFFCPKAFTAQKISYTRNFTQQTEVGVCQGWETIALPFDVESIKHETNGEIAPFAKGDKNAKPFWLYELSPEAGFQSAASIRANTPYIISMPNSMAYSDEYILGGKVTFSANNARVAATTASSSKNPNREFITTFEQIAKGDGIYALNVGEEYQGYRPGSIFADNYRDVKPFEAYLTTAQAAQAFSLQFGGGVTGIDNLPVKNVEGVKAWANGSTLFIQSDKARKVMVFSTTGMLMKTVAVEAGETASVSDLPSGIYIVNNKKVAIKR